MINEESIVCKKSLNTILYTESEKKLNIKDCKLIIVFCNNSITHFRNFSKQFGVKYFFWCFKTLKNFEN